MTSPDPTVPLPPIPERGGRLFVLRVWHEPATPPHTPAWRASVMHGAHGQRRYFDSIDDCVEHLYSTCLHADLGLPPE